MITKTISNIGSDHYPGIRGNMRQFVIVAQTHNTITATGSESAWEDLGLTLPPAVTVTTVE